MSIEINNRQLDFSARENDLHVHPQFIERWSPRAFQSYQIESAELQRIIEAARWSPSCFNAQPWRFYTSTQNTFDDFLGLLVEANQEWVKDTSAIGFLVAKKNFAHNGKPNFHYQFDCGAAWMAMSLQARIEGLYAHGLGGIKTDEVADYLKIDTTESLILMGFSLGKLADLESLSDEQCASEVPNERLPLADIWKQV